MKKLLVVLISVLLLSCSWTTIDYTSISSTDQEPSSCILTDNVLKIGGVGLYDTYKIDCVSETDAKWWDQFTMKDYLQEEHSADEKEER